MTTEFEHQTGQEFLAVYELIRELSQRVDFLERELDDVQENIRSLETEVGQHTDEFNNFRCEIDELAAEVETVLSDPQYE
jgi:chromosome segregation ATPase